MTAEQGAFTIGIPLYQGVDLMDVAAPYEIFNWMGQKWQGGPGVKVLLMAETSAPITTRDGLQMLPQTRFDQAAALDLLWVPGGDVEQLKQTMNDQRFLDFLRMQSRTATYVTSVCEGALLLASAGLLDGFKATTHWAFIPCLREYSAITVIGGEALDGVNVYYPRFVVDDSRAPQEGIRVTGGGISSGLDEALELVKLICGAAVAEEVQTTIQYFPIPPVNAVLPKADSCPL